MERGKSSTGRGGKSKAQQHPQDIFALGSKSTVVVNRDADKRAMHKPSTSGVDRKRDSSTFGGPPPGKRSRIGSPAESVSSSLDVDPVDLVPNVLQALDTHNSDKLLGLLTGSIRLLKSQRSKPDPILCMSMLYLCKIRPNMFAHETVAQSLCGLLKREQGTGFKSKGNPLVFVLACNMLYAAHKDSRGWPDTFIKVYIEDALNERWWVECSWCKCLVENIITAFNTKTPPPHLMPSDCTLGTMSPSSSGSPLTGNTEEDIDVSELEYSVYPRYSASNESVEALVLEAIKDQIQRRAAPDAIGKGFLKLLSATCGFPEIRMISAARLEGWLHSGKLWRAAQQLLAHVTHNADAAAPRDHEVLAQLARMRLKTKPIVTSYLACLREMVSENPGILRSVVTHIIYNELSNVRSPNNMAVLAALIQAQPLLVPQAMAETYQELLMRTEEYVRPLRSLTREMVRLSRSDAVQALLPLARALTAQPPHEPDSDIRERAFASLADLLCLCCLLTASHAKHLPEYKQQICCIQAAAVDWMLSVAAPLYRPSRNEYQHALHKIMFLESAEVYSKVDNWPPESERASIVRVCCDIPLQQYTLLRLIYIGHTKELPVAPGETFELVELLVRRACALPPEDDPLQMDKLEIADYIFQLCQYKHPDNITLPDGYTAPSLAITSLYWRGWLLLVMLAAHNPHEFAPLAAAKYPTLRALLECCITNSFTADWSNGVDYEAEKETILEMETHLATASNAKLPITEQTSRLLVQLTIMDPLGPARKPPSLVLEALQQLSGQLRLGRLLCRQPALLVDIVERHGTRRAMPWLQQLLHHSQLELSVLPVQCLCEFLSAGGSAGADTGKAPELAAHLRRTVRESAAGARAVLHYYMQRLAHAAPHARHRAGRGLKLVLSQGPPEEVNNIDWDLEVGPEEWLDLLWELEQWEAVRGDVMDRLRAACLVECTPKHLAAYIAFLTKYVVENDREDVQNVVLDMSQVVMERVTLLNALMPVDSSGRDQHVTLHNLTLMFYTYSQRIRLTRGPEWVSGATAGTVLLVVAHATIKLLCYGPALYDTNNEMYSWLMSTWLGGQVTLNPDDLLPDWLRIHLVRSARPTLMEAGLRGLPANKLAVFIQTFGMPVPAMSALLAALDACPAGSLLRLGLERAYMSQLLCVQHRRGVTGGRAFAATLGLTEAELPPPDDLFAEEPVLKQPEDPWSAGEPLQTLPLGQIAPLLAIFGGLLSYEEDPDAAFTLLHATMSEELSLAQTFPYTACPYTHNVILYLHGALTSASSYQYAVGMLQRPSYSVPLARCIKLVKHEAMLRPRIEICEILLKHFKMASGPLVAILRDIVEANTTIKPDMDLHEPPQLPSNATKQQIISALEAATPLNLEQLGNHVIHTQDTKLVVDVITQILEDSQHGLYENRIKVDPESSGAGFSEAHIFSRRGLGCGLLIDWMAELQPDILGPDPQAQMRLMFRPGGAVWRTQLVTLLAHRASWQTLHSCLTHLLHDTDGWAPSAVLELAQTLAQSQRVWKNRDQEDLLRLNHHQLHVLVQYMVEECAAGGRARIPLLLQCCSDPPALLRAAAVKDPLLLLLLHAQVPKILQLLSGSGPRPLSASIAHDLEETAQSAPNATDRLTHCMLTALSAPGSDTTTKQRLEAGIRGLWARHWRAGARALPLVAALLRGTPARGHTHRALLCAVEMLPTHVLQDPQHSKDMESILESYMSACVTSSGGRDHSLAHRTAALLRAYHAAAPSSDLHKRTIPALAALVSEGPRGRSSATPPPQALRTLQLSHASERDLQAALQELESWGSRRGGAWGGGRAADALAAAAAPLLSHAAVAVRQHAATLLVAVLPAAPNPAPAQQAIIACLESEVAEIQASMLERLPALVCGAPQMCSAVLARVFDLAVRSRHCAEACLVKCVAGINLQRGC